MAGATAEKCQKLFDEIIQSLPEYSKEDISNPEAIKSEILELLKTYRPVKLADYEYGLSHALKKDHHLIVKEKEDKTKVKIFSKSGISWFCSNNVSKNYKCKSYLKIKYGIVFVTSHHTKLCASKDYSFVMEIQEFLKQGKTKEAHLLAARFNKKSLNNDSNISLSSSMLNDSTLSTATDMENVSTLELSVTDDTTQNTDASLLVQEPSGLEVAHESFVNSNANENTSTSIDSNSSQQLSSLVNPASESTAARSSVKRELTEGEDCKIIDEPVAKKPKIETTIIRENYSFDLPSASILKEVCEKLKIDYHRDAYKFWGDIAFENVPVSSDIIETHKFKSSNIFISLSLFFTGEITKCYSIQDTILTAFREELIASGTRSNAEVDQIFINATVTDQQNEFIAKFLSCRIGIYENGELKKYGNWEDEKVVLTLILAFIDEKYSVVVNL
uniref:Uncharacterized protein n=1 Tax=Panagrolaimus sp. ES5 TaxID=591445 RepID=A0AC34F427_9BILA